LLLYVNAPDKDIDHGTLMLSGLDSCVLNDEFKRVFGFYGEIKEVSVHCWFLPVLVA